MTNTGQPRLRAGCAAPQMTRIGEITAWAALAARKGSAVQEPLRDGGPARRRVFPRAAREGYLRARAASAPRPRDLDRRVRSRVCRARAGSRAGPRRYGACPRLARRRPQVELQVEVQPGLVRRVRQRPAPVGDQPPRIPRPSAPSPPPDRREFSLARRAPSAAVRRVRGFWSGGPPVPQGLLLQRLARRIDRPETPASRYAAIFSCYVASLASARRTWPYV